MAHLSPMTPHMVREYYKKDRVLRLSERRYNTGVAHFLYALLAIAQTAVAAGDASFLSSLGALRTQAALEAVPFRADLGQGDVLQGRARALAEAISEEPQGLQELLDPNLLAKVPVEVINEAFRSYHASFGRVRQVKLIERVSDLAGRFQFIYENGAVQKMGVQLSPNPPHRITSMPQGLPALPGTIADLATRMRALPGTVSFQAARLGPTVQPLHELNQDRPLGIGSAFKLYVLAALVEDHRNWDEVLAISDEFKSLPSGELQSWPAGSTLTVRDMAHRMISRSDNTATDHLLRHAGRLRVERMLGLMGNADPSRSIPFFSTVELFKLKYDGGLRARYLAADAPGRRSLLDGEVRRMPRDGILEWAVEHWKNPIAIDTAEWFASAADLVRAMDWIRRRGDAEALDAMDDNPGLDFPKDVFPYVGFKGGSEPGVLNMTWLLRDKHGVWWSVSAGWNDPAKEVDSMYFAGLLQGVVSQLAKLAAAADQ